MDSLDDHRKRMLNPPEFYHKLYLLNLSQLRTLASKVHCKISHILKELTPIFPLHFTILHMSRIKVRKFGEKNVTENIFTLVGIAVATDSILILLLYQNSVFKRPLRIFSPKLVLHQKRVFYTFISI